MKWELARLDIRELVRLAREGDRIALGEVSDRMPGCLYEIATNGEGDWRSSRNSASHRISKLLISDFWRGSDNSMKSWKQKRARSF